jgi:hypothetical protein
MSTRREHDTVLTVQFKFLSPVWHFEKRFFRVFGEGSYVMSGCFHTPPGEFCGAHLSSYDSRMTPSYVHSILLDSARMNKHARHRRDLQTQGFSKPWVVPVQLEVYGGREAVKTRQSNQTKVNTCEPVTIDRSKASKRCWLRSIH